MSLGDFAPSSIIYGKFATTRPSTGAPFTLAGTPALSVYKDNSTTQSTAGITLTVDFDGVTGLHHFTIDTSADGAFYSAGSDFDIVITAGTVDSVSVVGIPVGKFSLNKISSLRPTTSGRTLDVSSGGEAGIDWANIGSPTTSVNFSNTTVGTTTTVTNGVTVTTNNDKTGYSLTQSFPTNFASLAINASGHVILQDASLVTAKLGTFTLAKTTNITGFNDIAATAIVSGGAITTSAGAISTVTNVTTVNGFAANSITASALAADAVAEIADGVWDEPIAGHLSAGSTGSALNAAGSSGDPWATVLPGAYGAGTAGNIVGNNLNATVSSRLASSAVPTNFSSLAINASGHVILQDASLVTAKLGTFALAKGTNITGFNDIAATSIVSGGAITTSGGAVSTVTSITNTVNANAIQISGDTVAADNLELFFDGTGYNASTSTVGTVTNVTNVTNNVNANLVLWRSSTPNNLVSGRVDSVLGAYGTNLAPWGFQRNTAYSGFTFPMFSSTDHITPVTGLTVTAQRSIDGGAFASTTNAVTELSNGFYVVNLTAADLNGTNEVTLRFTASGADMASYKIPLQGK